MQTIRKYRLDLNDLHKRLLGMNDFGAPTGLEIEMPEGARILSAGFQESTKSLWVWALVDTDAPPRKRLIEVAGTGHGLSDLVEEAEFIGTVLMPPDGGVVYHLFDLGEKR